MFTTIKKDEKGFIIKNGEIERIIGPGIYFLKNINVLNIYKNFGYVDDQKIQILYKENPSAMADHFFIFDLCDYEIGILTVEGKVIDLLRGGKKYFYLKGKFQMELKKIDLRNNPEISQEYFKDFLLLKLKYGRVDYLEEYIISHNQKAVLLINGKIIKVLDPGKYLFYSQFDAIQVVIFETSKNKLELSGQELLTKDKYNLRINATVFFSLNNIVKFLELYGEGFDIIYAESQFGLREIIANYSLDELFEKKDSVSFELSAYISKKINKDAITIENIGMKDIILPGEMREIMNQVIQAEKTSQVNAIKRRDEVACVRNMLNTAKLYEENPMLLRLKEIDTLEKIVEKIKNLNVNNGFDGLLDLVKIRK